MPQDLGYKYQVTFFINKSVQEEGDLFETEKFEKLIGSKSKKYNDITKISSINFNKRLEEYEVKSSINEDVTPEQIRTAAAQVISSFIINDDWNNQKCFIVITNRTESESEIITLIKNDWWDAIRKKVEKYLIKSKTTNKYSEKTSLEIIDNMEIQKIIHNKRIKGAPYYSHYKENVFEIFKNEITSSLAPGVINDEKCKLLFEQFLNAFNNGNSNAMFLNRNVIKLFFLYKEISDPERVLGVMRWIREEISLDLYNYLQANSVKNILKSDEDEVKVYELVEKINSIISISKSEIISDVKELGKFNMQVNYLIELQRRVIEDEIVIEKN